MQQPNMGSPNTLFPTPGMGQQDDSIFPQFAENRNSEGGVKMAFLAPLLTSLLGGAVGGLAGGKKGFKTGIQAGLGVGAQFLEGKVLRREEDRKERREDKKSRLEQRKLGLDEAQFSEDLRTSNQGSINSAINRYENALETGNTSRANLALGQIVRHTNRGFQMGFISNERRNQFAKITDEDIQKGVVSARERKRVNTTLDLISNPADNNAEIFSQRDVIQSFMDSPAFEQLTDAEKDQLKRKDASLTRSYDLIVNKDARERFQEVEALLASGYVYYDPENKTAKSSSIEGVIGTLSGNLKNLANDAYVARQRQVKEAYHMGQIRSLSSGLRLRLDPDLRSDFVDELTWLGLSRLETREKASKRAEKIVGAIYKGQDLKLRELLWTLEHTRRGKDGSGYPGMGEGVAIMTDDALFQKYGLGYMRDRNAISDSTLIPTEPMAEKEWQKRSVSFFQPEGSKEERADPSYASDRHKVGVVARSLIATHQAQGFPVPPQFIEDYNAYAGVVDGLEPMSAPPPSPGGGGGKLPSGLQGGLQRSINEGYTLNRGKQAGPSRWSQGGSGGAVSSPTDPGLRPEEPLYTPGLPEDMPEDMPEDIPTPSGATLGFDPVTSPAQGDKQTRSGRVVLGPTTLGSALGVVGTWLQEKVGAGPTQRKVKEILNGVKAGSITPQAAKKQLLQMAPDYPEAINDAVFEATPKAGRKWGRQ